MVKRNEGAFIDRVDKVEHFMDATRASAERQAAGGAALQQRADEAQSHDLMKALAVWGMANEARFPDQMSWWDSTVEAAVRPLLLKDRDLVGVDVPAMPPRLLFRTSDARAHHYAARGLRKLHKGAGNKAKSVGVKLQGGPRIRLAYIETKTDEERRPCCVQRRTW